MTAPLHWTDGQWLKIIEDLLGADGRKQEVARTTLWCEVLHYIVHSVRLDIGPLSDDEEVRRDIGVHVLKKLEANSYAHVRKWMDRREHIQERSKDCSSWWAFIKLVAKRCGIDYARTCTRNVARRGEPFQWVRVELTDPAVFDDTLEDSTEFLAHCSESAVYGFLERFQASHGTMSSEPPPLPVSAPAAPTRSRRDRS